MPYREETIGDCRLILGDCLEIMPTLEPMDALLTDPPYGIKAHNGFDGFGGMGTPIARRQYDGQWDNDRPSKVYFDAMLSSANTHIIWGGNYFTDLLPVSRKWLFWDKCQTMPTYSDGELAWTSIPGVATKRIIYNNNGLMAKEKDRVHPTQKPVGVMKWCINQLPDSTQTVFDPFFGSGTTLVACAHMGLKGIGIEIDEKFFDIACKRIEEAYKQPRLFSETPQKIKQEAFL